MAELRESGPVYVAHDEAPRLVWDTDAEAALATTLLPVIRARGLDADIAASIWLLVRIDGRVEATAIQVSSGDPAFDAAAVRAARGMLFAPALRGGRVAPVWVLREISLLMP
ncbi:TonB family protein [Candidatus Palauibacter sp.]|uniref:TonB family protein n=1 Tax=Candidatus Palauibacter sp. TaxID=3101350 RepID=UPI003B52DBD6